MSTTSRRRRCVGGLLLALSLVPVAGLAWACTADRGLVWTHRLDRPLLLGLVALGCLGVGVAVLAPRWSTRAPLLALCALAVAVWVPIGWLLGPPPTVATLESRRGALEVVVQDLTVTKLVVVRQPGLGPRARQWDAACLRGDSGTAVLGGMRWLDGGRLRVVSDSGAGTITLDRSTGEPVAVAGALDPC